MMSILRSFALLLVLSLSASAQAECPELRQALLDAAADLGLEVAPEHGSSITLRGRRITEVPVVDLASIPPSAYADGVVFGVAQVIDAADPAGAVHYGLFLRVEGELSLGSNPAFVDYLAVDGTVVATARARVDVHSLELPEQPSYEHAFVRHDVDFFSGLGPGTNPVLRADSYVQCSNGATICTSDDFVFGQTSY
ncbi:MAG: hypothetical protein AAF533_14125 [Acidobacteriota bacterium]